MHLRPYGHHDRPIRPFRRGQKRRTTARAPSVLISTSGVKNSLAKRYSLFLAVVGESFVGQIKREEVPHEKDAMNGTVVVKK
jgi:hypothetical protein